VLVPLVELEPEPDVPVGPVPVLVVEAPLLVVPLLVVPVLVPVDAPLVDEPAAVLVPVEPLAVLLPVDAPAVEEPVVGVPVVEVLAPAEVPVELPPSTIPIVMVPEQPVMTQATARATRAMRRLITSDSVCENSLDIETRTTEKPYRSFLHRRVSEPRARFRASPPMPDAPSERIDHAETLAGRRADPRG
jgi:hypothetical protein